MREHYGMDLDEPSEDEKYEARMRYARRRDDDVPGTWLPPRRVVHVEPQRRSLCERVGGMCMRDANCPDRTCEGNPQASPPPEEPAPAARTPLLVYLWVYVSTSAVAGLAAAFVTSHLSH